MGSGLPGPRGSLLVWLDNYLDDPRTTRGRMAGRSRNLVRAAAVPGRDPRIEERIHMKVYGSGWCRSATQPQKHGQFSSRYKFWDRGCVDPATGNTSCLLEGEPCDETIPGREPCFSSRKKGR